MKRMPIIKPLFFFLFISMAFTLQAQDVNTQKADNAYATGNYNQAIKFYKALLPTANDTYITRRIGTAYRKLKDYDNAEIWYEKLITKPGATVQDMADYGRILNDNGKFEKTMEVLGEYEKKNGVTTQISELLSSALIGRQLQSEPDIFAVKEAPFNSKASDISPQYFQNGVVFTSNRTRGYFTRWSYSANDAPYYDLYFSPVVPPFEITRVKGNAASGLHDAGASYSADQSSMYFARSYHSKGRSEGFDPESGVLCIVKSTFNGKKWKDLEWMDFNDPTCSYGHPSVSGDGNMLFMVSDKPGGYGGTDLYISFKEEEGWGEPVNLGPEINTSGDEMFPYIYNSKILFFASSGHPGRGGLDMFYTTIVEGEWGLPKDVGAPINSSFDDFGIIVNKKGDGGYFSSNREGGTGGDDIYEFKRKTHITGTVTDAVSGAPVPDAEVILLYPNNSIEKSTTGPDGKYSYYVRSGTEIMLKVRHGKYQEKKQQVSTAGRSTLEDLVVDIQLQKADLFSLSGVVRDGKTGGPVEGATVHLTGNGKDFKATSDELGNYMMNLGYTPDVYSVIASKDGYLPILKKVSTEGHNEPHSFTMDLDMVPGEGYLIEVKVVEEGTRKALPDVKVVFVDPEFSTEYYVTTTDNEGKFVGVVSEPGFIVTASPEKYFSQITEIPPPSGQGKDYITHVTIEMVPYELGKMVRRVHFDYNKSIISEKAGKDLYSFVYFLKVNSKAKVELSAHTDSRGSKDYNQELSELRAVAVKKFLTERGISEDRIVTKGYGESKLLNECIDNVPCKDEEHYLNRRCELKVIGL